MSEKKFETIPVEPEVKEELKGDEIMISMSKNEFVEKVTPKKVDDPNELFFLKCECGNVHFRHAGYVQALIPFMRVDKSKHVENDVTQVMVCTKCKKCYTWMNQQMYDITNLIDLEAWEKTEKEMVKATGVGGEC